MVSKVSSTLGLSSASIAASDNEFSRSSSSRSASASAASSAPSSPLALPLTAAGLNGVGPAGAAGGVAAMGCGTSTTTVVLAADTVPSSPTTSVTLAATT